MVSPESFNASYQTLWRHNHGICVYLERENYFRRPSVLKPVPRGMWCLLWFMVLVWWLNNDCRWRWSLLTGKGDMESASFVCRLRYKSSHGNEWTWTYKKWTGGQSRDYAEAMVGNGVMLWLTRVHCEMWMCVSFWRRHEVQWLNLVLEEFNEITLKSDENEMKTSAEMCMWLLWRKEMFWTSGEYNKQLLVKYGHNHWCLFAVHFTVLLKSVPRPKSCVSIRSFSRLCTTPESSAHGWISGCWR